MQTRAVCAAILAASLTACATPPEPVNADLPKCSGLASQLGFQAAVLAKDAKVRVRALPDIERAQFVAVYNAIESASEYEPDTVLIFSSPDYQSSLMAMFAGGCILVQELIPNAILDQMLAGRAA